MMIEQTNENKNYLAMDGLGNRTTVNLRSGVDQVYNVNDLTNRYTAIDSPSQNLIYDTAGNLTQDHDGYRYVYGHENRIARIYKVDGQTEITVAQYAYDALGRRIWKYDPAETAANTYYYYNDQWQILCEYTDDSTCRQWLTYGNYVDEVLSRSTNPTAVLAMQFYAHDHLYSPAALAISTGYTVLERYEYDAYGKVAIIARGTDNTWYTADDITLTASANNNLFTFTGRQLDILDGGALHHMHYRHRDYSPQLSRFMQEDPYGIILINSHLNFFNPQHQYLTGVNVYDYILSNPIILADSYGLTCSPCGSQEDIDAQYKECKANVAIQTAACAIAGRLTCTGVCRGNRWCTAGCMSGVTSLCSAGAYYGLITCDDMKAWCENGGKGPRPGGIFSPWPYLPGEEFPSFP